jgi:hypothetical protein
VIAGTEPRGYGGAGPRQEPETGVSASWSMRCTNYDLNELKYTAVMLKGQRETLAPVTGFSRRNDPRRAV